MHSPSGSCLIISLDLYQDVRILKADSKHGVRSLGNTHLNHSLVLSDRHSAVVNSNDEIVPPHHFIVERSLQDHIATPVDGEGLVIVSADDGEVQKPAPSQISVLGSQRDHTLSRGVVFSHSSRVE